MNRKVLISSFLGNALEFYDFTLYGVFAGLFAVQFFPSSNPINGLLASWGAFAAGFIMRPFGATLFGFIGDKFGRKKALGLSIIFMGIPTLILGLLPTYQSIGIMAPLMLVMCRLLQGLCTGGEYNGAAIFAIEHHAHKGNGLISGIITSSCVLGALSATGIGYVILHYGNPQWGWRIAFILGALISLIGFFIRNRVDESPDFLKEEAVKSSYMPHIYETIKYNGRSFFMTFLLGSINGVLSYSLFGFLNMYLNKYLHINMDIAVFANLFGLLAFMVSCPIAGIILDRIGINNFILASLSLVLIIPVLVYNLLELKDLYFLIIAQVIYGVLVGIVAGPQHAIAKSIFPTSYRYTGVSLSFCTGMGFIGGSMPLMATYLIEKTGNIYIPAAIVSTLGFLTLLYYLLFIRTKVIKRAFS
jgi:MHS family proline/betaine transporter-like MFS transporter